MVVIIIGATGGYYFIAHYGTLYMSKKVKTQLPTPDSAYCQKDQLETSMSTQGAAGNIYDELIITNKGKKACLIVLGNTITALFNAKNIITHYIEIVPNQNYTLAPSATVYSQVHYPNGPQCQNGIHIQPLTLYYKTAQITIPFTPGVKGGKLVVQACRSQNEKTSIDIWPLSKQPISTP